MKRLTHCCRRHARRAVTLVEVLFSVGVILIGLLGLLSILPLAGKRAKDSVALSTSANYAESIFSKLKAEKYFSTNRLRAFENNNPINVAVFSNNSVTNLGSGGPIPSFCIDPLFRAIVDSNLDNLPNPGSYLAGAFPFYDQKFTPPADPSTSPQSTMQPRMFRVAPKSRTLAKFLDAATSWRIAELPDELGISRPKDKTLATRVSTGVYDNPTKKWTRKIPPGQFTWMATVNPLPGGVYASVAVVIFKQRERNIQAFEPPSQERTNEKSERLAKVVNWVGFNGGGGGVVTLQGNDQVDNDLTQGDWIMLSRYIRYIRHINGFRDVHHWYRVMQCDDEPVDPGSPWRKTVTLDGPDCTFTNHANLEAKDQDDARYVISESDASGTLSVSSETQATILSDVVSVTERIMKLSDL
jgi:hypothetical protein